MHREAAMDREDEVALGGGPHCVGYTFRTGYELLKSRAADATCGGDWVTLLACIKKVQYPFPPPPKKGTSSTLSPLTPP